MSEQIYFLYILISFLSFAVSLGAGLLMLSKSVLHCGKYFGVLMLCMSAHILFNFLYTASTNYHDSWLWLQFSSLFLNLTPVLWYLLVYSFVNRNVSKRQHFFLLIPIFALLTAASNNWHHLFYTSVFYKHEPYISLIKAVKGPAYYVFVLLEYSIAVIGIHLLYRKDKSDIAQEVIRAKKMLIGVVVLPAAANIWYLSGFSPFSLDFTPQVFVLVGFYVAQSLHKNVIVGVVGTAFEQIFNSLEHGVIITGCDSRILNFNSAMSELVSAKVPLDRDDYIEDFFNRVNALILNKGNCIACFAMQNESELVHYEVRSTIIRGPDNVQIGSIYSFENITHYEEQIQAFSKEATTDYLTSINNRRGFMKDALRVLDIARTEGLIVHVVLLDIDNFKQVNDKHGHTVGDKVLIKIASVCRDYIRQHDSFARYGGEEFIGLLYNTTHDSILSIVERIRAVIETVDFSHYGVSESITVSIGISVAEPKRSYEIDQLISEADKALYHAKKNGKNQVVMYCDLMTKKKYSIDESPSVSPNFI